MNILYVVLSLQKFAHPLITTAAVRGIWSDPHVALAEARSMRETEFADHVHSLEIHAVPEGKHVSLKQYLDTEKPMMVWQAKRMGMVRPHYDYWSEHFHGPFGSYDLLPVETGEWLRASPNKFAIVVDLQGTFYFIQNELPSFTIAMRAGRLVSRMNEKVLVYDDKGRAHRCNGVPRTTNMLCRN